MSHTLPTVPERRFPWSIATPALVALACFGARLLLVRQLPEGELGRRLVTGALALAAAWLVVAIVRHTRSLDEFQQRLQGLALGFAFPAGLAATFALGLLASEGLITRFDPLDVPLVLVSAYLGGLALAQRRYR
jgi:hypothetical protein